MLVVDFQFCAMIVCSNIIVSPYVIDVRRTAHSNPRLWIESVANENATEIDLQFTCFQQQLIRSHLPRERSAQIFKILILFLCPLKTVAFVRLALNI